MSFTRDRTLTNVSLITALLVCASSAATPVAGQIHSDIEFFYADGKIQIEPTTAPGLVFDAKFPDSGIEQQFATLPGMASEIDVGLGIGPRDEITYNVLDSLLYWNGSFATPPADTHIRVRNNPPSETFITAGSGVQRGGFDPPINRIGAADASGDFHVDLQWFLEPNNFPEPPPTTMSGAYGVKLSLSTSAANVADSDPLYMLFHLGLDEQSVQQAIDAFAALLTPALAADFDEDGDVDRNDLHIWQPNYGTAIGASRAMGDADDDRDVDGGDFLIWQRMAGSDSAFVTATLAVPEPSSCWLLVASAMVAFLRGHRRRAGCRSGADPAIASRAGPRR